MNAVVEPMLDFLQCTLGKRGGTHNHLTAFCAVFLLRPSHRSPTGMEPQNRSLTGVCAFRHPATTSVENRTMPRFLNQGWGISASKVRAPRSDSVQSHGLPRRPRGLEGRDIGLVPEGDADVVQTLQQAPPRVVVDVEGVLD